MYSQWPQKCKDFALLLLNFQSRQTIRPIAERSRLYELMGKNTALIVHILEMFPDGRWPLPEIMMVLSQYLEEHRWEEELTEQLAEVRITCMFAY